MPTSNRRPLGAKLRKAAPYLALLAFLLIYPFTQPFVRWATNFAYGVGDAAPVEVTITRPGALTRYYAALGDSNAIAHVDSLQAKESTAIAAAQAAASQNAASNEIAADQLAGGGVQLGTFITKLWIAIVFYLLFCSLPWLVQGLTHPGPTAWAKRDYTTDFDGLSPTVKFESYGRLQLINTIKIVGAALAAALLV